MASKITVEELQSTGSSLPIKGNVKLDVSGNTDYFEIPKGYTSDRGTPAEGAIRWNIDFNAIEVFDGTEWKRLKNLKSEDLMPKGALTLLLDATDRRSFGEVNRTIDYYHFYDISGNANNGFTTGGTLDYNVVNSPCVQYSNARSDCGRITPGESDFTVGFIYQLTGTGGRGGLFERKPSPPYNGFSLGQGGTGNWGFVVSGLDPFSNSLEVNYPSYPSINTWYFDVGVYQKDENRVSSYRNGSFYQTATGSAQGNLETNGTRTGFLVANRDNLVYLPCRVGMVFAYSRALSAAEITQVYNLYKDKFGI